MEHSDFSIGLEFMMSGRRYRCTDVGSRVVVAISLDGIEKSTTGKPSVSMSKDEAQADGWFNGPPYPVPEIVIDEYDMEACEPIAAAA